MLMPTIGHWRGDTQLGTYGAGAASKGCSTSCLGLSNHGVKAGL
jgi:hypothetical protein